MRSELMTHTADLDFTSPFINNSHRNLGQEPIIKELS